MLDEGPGPANLNWERADRAQSHFPLSFPKPVANKASALPCRSTQQIQEETVRVVVTVPCRVVAKLLYLSVLAFLCSLLGPYPLPPAYDHVLAKEDCPVSKRETHNFLIVDDERRVNTDLESPMWLG